MEDIKTLNEHMEEAEIVITVRAIEAQFPTWEAQVIKNRNSSKPIICESSSVQGALNFVMKKLARE